MMEKKQGLGAEQLEEAASKLVPNGAFTFAEIYLTGENQTKLAQVPLATSRPMPAMLGAIEMLRCRTASPDAAGLVVVCEQPDNPLQIVCAVSREGEEYLDGISYASPVAVRLIDYLRCALGVSTYPPSLPVAMFQVKLWMTVLCSMGEIKKTQNHGGVRYEWRDLWRMSPFVRTRNTDLELPEILNLDGQEAAYFILDDSATQGWSDFQETIKDQIASPVIPWDVKNQFKHLYRTDIDVLTWMDAGALSREMTRNTPDVGYQIIGLTNMMAISVDATINLLDCVRVLGDVWGDNW